MRRSSLNFMLMTYLLSVQLFAQIPEKKAFFIQTGGGIGFHSSVIVDEEQRFADNNDFSLILSNGQNAAADSINLNYKKYTGYNFYLRLHYFIQRKISVGLIWQYNNIVQTADLPAFIKKNESYKMLRLNQVGPQLTYWFAHKSIIFSLSANPNFTFGKLTRIPFIYAKMGEFKTPEEKEFFKDFHTPVDISGFGIGLSAGLNYISRGGLLLSFRLRYDFSKPQIRDNVFVYPDMPNVHNLFLQVGLGFVTKVKI